MDQNERRDIEIWGAWGNLTALEVAVKALLASHPAPEALATAWRTAEDEAFEQTADMPGAAKLQLETVRENLVNTLNVLRSAAGVR
jgi:hypothetical protein